MGQGFSQKLLNNWVGIAAVVALAFCAANAFTISYVSKKKVVPCVVDVWKLSMNGALQYSTAPVSDTASDAAKMQGQKERQKEIDEYLNKLQQIVSTPDRMGCGFVAVRGSILGIQVRDITEDVQKELNASIK